MELMRIPVTVVILAAGLGTRMKSRKAKVLHRAGGKALIEHVVETALKLAPAERIFVVVGHQADDVRKAVAGMPGASGIGFIEQTEQKGTGPCQPCSWKLHRPEGILTLGVLQEGEVGAGDHIVKRRDGPERMSVADIDALLYLPRAFPASNCNVRCGSLHSARVGRVRSRQCSNKTSAPKPRAGNPGLRRGATTSLPRPSPDAGRDYL